jgi:hypothetical protein
VHSDMEKPNPTPLTHKPGKYSVPMVLGSLTAAVLFGISEAFMSKRESIILMAGLWVVPLGILAIAWAKRKMR